MVTARIHVRVVANARKSEVVGVRAGRILARVKAPPREGKANAELCRLLARAFGVPPSRFAIVKGARAKDKTVQISGADAELVRATVQGLEKSQ